MRNEYNELDEFVEDVHNLSLHDEIISMGLVDKDDFKGQFINCIFHGNDDTPSLQITDNFFKCYACNAKGDLFNFVMLYYNIDFMDAVKKLAEFYKVKIKSLRVNYDSKAAKLKREWDAYLKAMEKAPDVVKRMKRDFFPQEIGYDARSKYVVLALTGKTGTILGFTKRRVDELHEKNEKGKFQSPKWKHSSLSDSLISQCHNIFNLYNASKEIRKSDVVILCEGPKDVIAYQRINHQNVVCCCGTGNSNNIWDLLMPVGNIYLSMDNDASGIKATISTVLHLAPIYDVKRIFSILLPEGQDPYDVVIQKDGKESLKQYLNQAVSSVEFFIKYADISDIKKLYDYVPEYNKVFVLKCVCNEKGMGVSQAESWINDGGTDGAHQNPSKPLQNGENQMSEKDMLIAFLTGKNDDSIPMMDEKRARRILKMKYGVDINQLNQ